MVESEEVEEAEIVWGRSTGTGGKNKKVRFYESFTYDNVEYFKYDDVYLFREGEPEPSIGKLLKMWETGDKQKKGKVLWFFQPAEVSNFVGAEAVLENEVFLASGDAPGLTNINPLEAIAGKCDVVCISKDSRNRQPTDEEVRNADFVFRRTFDVDCCKIKDEIEEQIAGIDVKFLLNRVDSEEGCSKLKLNADSGKKKVSETAVQNDLTATYEPVAVPKDSDAVNTNGCCANSANEAAASLNVLLTKPESSTQETTIACLEPENAEKSIVRKALVVGVESEGKGKRLKDSDDLDNRPSKKAKTTCENVDKRKNGFDHDDDAMEALTPTTSVGRKNETKPSKKEERPSQESNLDRKTKLANGKLVKRSSEEGPSEVFKNEEQELVVASKDKSKWFMDRPWEDELWDAHQHGKLVLLQNLYPSFTSAEVKDLIVRVFEENCKAKMIQRTAFCNPHCGRAYVIFDTRDAAEMVIKKLQDGCLLLPNGRIVVASPGTPCFPEKKPTFFGHFVIEKLKYLFTREQKDAISTSHCSQPNTMEHDMATEWCLLHKRSESQWKKLYEKHGQDMRQLKAELTSRR